jgi:hypothetical protein
MVEEEEEGGGGEELKGERKRRKFVVLVPRRLFLLVKVGCLEASQAPEMRRGMLQHAADIS